jgi:hypothetical protein
MIIKTKLSSIFGPNSSIIGSIFIGIGIITLLTTWKAIFLIVAGLFFGFTNKVSIIDTDKRRVKSQEVYAGVIPFGKWISVDASMSLGYKTITEGYTMRSLSNRQMNIANTKFVLILYDQDDMPIMTLMKFDTQIDLQIQMEQLSELLNVSI